MAACPECGFAAEGAFRFCPDCGTPLTVPPPGLAEERKVVTALFCDLVGFTSMSESADPEDVDQMLRTYFAVVRVSIEAYGGLVEKFIGDAVVGVFGVPAAHEDDPERAVRAGLRIAEEAEKLSGVGGAPLLLRVGINTGEALVRLGVSPESGRSFLAGDAINTAARIQSVAPAMGVAVGLSTYDATALVFDYVELEPASVKGKADPLRVFRAIEPRARFGTDLTRTHDSPFVGREIDLALLKGIFDKSVAAASVQLVTVVGEPGLGKSRIVAELFGYIDARPELVTWRQGRCLPYGKGITFWALGEIVKAHAGILETDPPDVATAKLDVALPDGAERAWFRQRLLPLLGIEAKNSAGRDELFTAWRRFLEHLAETHPTVLVFEDLHWADEAMLAFIEHLADRAEGVPLLVVGTARPELFEHHPDFMARLRNTNTVNLAPLSEPETARLVSALLDSTVAPAELQRPILERSGGNPLYAEEFVRLLKDGNLLTAEGAGWVLKDGAEVPLPDSVQAVIAARLDTLSPDMKSLLADAAVVGKVFWAGAVASMGERQTSDVLDALRELSRKELVRVSRRSSIEGDTEYAFWHVLTRDVAYAQLPRASRAARHVAAARWLETVAPDRVEDLADVLAHHYATALELARAAGHTDQATILEAPALRFLVLAGDRALGLDTAAVLSSFERALALTPPGHPYRAETLTRFGDAAFQSGHLADAGAALDEAITTYRARNDLPAAAETMVTLTMVLHTLGDPRWTELPAEAVALLEALTPGPEMVAALTRLASTEGLRGRYLRAIGFAQQAVDLAERLGVAPPARAFGDRGWARASLGDRDGLVDFREAIALATAAGQGRDATVLHNNLGLLLWQFDGPAAALEVLAAGIAFAQDRGLTEIGDHTRGSSLHPLVEAGHLDHALEVAADLTQREGVRSGVLTLASVAAVETRALVIRGQAATVAHRLDWLDNAARGTQDPQEVVLCLSASAMARVALDQPSVGAALLTELEAMPGVRETAFYGPFLPSMVRTALTVRRLDLAERLVVVEARHPYTEHSLVAANAALAEARGNPEAAVDAYADAARRWRDFGAVPEQGYALLGRGRCLVALDRPTEATGALLAAREVFEELGATPALKEIVALLGRTREPS